MPWSSGRSGFALDLASLDTGYREKNARGMIGVLEVRLALVTSSDYVEDIDSEDNG